MNLIEMPKTYRERLDAIAVGDGIIITGDSRHVWQTNITRMHSTTNKQFTIRTNRETKEVRVWRLPDVQRERTQAQEA